MILQPLSIAPGDVKAIDAEVRAGLPNERKRLDEALFCREFYDGNFERFPVRAPEGWEPYRYERHTRFLRFVVNLLTKNLYREGPARSLPDYPAAEVWLNDIYKAWWVDAAWQQADRMATWGGFAAWQVVGTEDPKMPVRYFLWGADELVVWLDDDDPVAVAAVGTRDCYDNRRRLRVWTEEELWTYQTEKFSGETSGMTTYRFVKAEPNPYGVIPFAFVHFDDPCARFTTTGPGPHLREINDTLNFTLTETGDSLRYEVRPVLAGYGIREGWRPPPARPGTYFDVPEGSGENALGTGNPSRLEFLQADAGFISATWQSIQNELDLHLETYGIPASAFRLDQSGVRSGVAIVAEQLPLLDWAQSRQRPYGRYEEALARLTLTVGAAHLANNGVSRADLVDAAADPNLVLKWGSMTVNFPGPDRDNADKFRLDNGLASRKDLLMERDGLTAEEADAKIIEIGQDRAAEAKALALVPLASLAPEPPAPPGKPLPPSAVQDPELERP